MEKSRVNLCLKRANRACKQKMTTAKLLHMQEALQLTLVVYIFKLVLYYNSIMISNQIKYNKFSEFFTDTVWFLQTRFADTQLWWLVIERARTKNSKKLVPGKWLFETSLLKVTKALILHESIMEVFFFFLKGGAKIVNAQGSDRKWHLTRWAKYIDTGSCRL